MIVRRNAAFAAIAALCLPLGQAAFAAPRESVTARIVTADLDLATVAGRRSLDRRIDGAIAKACASPMSGLAGKSDAARCRAEMIADAAPRIAALHDRATAVRVASAH